MQIRFRASNEEMNVYAHIWLDHKRIVDEDRCNLYVRIIADRGEFIECEEVYESGPDPDASFYVSKDVMAMARIEDNIS